MLPCPVDSSGFNQAPSSQRDCHADSCMIRCAARCLTAGDPTHCVSGSANAASLPHGFARRRAVARLGMSAMARASIAIGHGPRATGRLARASQIGCQTQSVTHCLYHRRGRPDRGQRMAMCGQSLGDLGFGHAPEERSELVNSRDMVAPCCHARHSRSPARWHVTSAMELEPWEFIEAPTAPKDKTSVCLRACTLLWCKSLSYYCVLCSRRDARAI